MADTELVTEPVTNAGLMYAVVTLAVGIAGLVATGKHFAATSHLPPVLTLLGLLGVMLSFLYVQFRVPGI